jgi:hypothetical protein
MGGSGAEKKKTDASQRGGGLRPSHSGTCRLEMPLGVYPAAEARTLTRSARETSSAKDWTCIFSITLWRWAFVHRGEYPYHHPLKD